MTSEYFDVPDPDDRTHRSTQRNAADARARLLSIETDVDHRMRWDNANRRYVVEEVPFVAPTRAWDEEFYPDRRSPNQEKSPTRFVKLDELVTQSANLSSFQWLSSTERPQNPAQYRADLQAALDIQYGRGHFWAYRHGSRISVQCRYPLKRTA